MNAHQNYPIEAAARRSIVITDSPEVVELKKKFRELDARAESLKFELEHVTNEKKSIAQKIFAVNEERQSVDWIKSQPWGKQFDK